MTTILVIYLAGAVINALVMSSIYDDLKRDEGLDRIRTTHVALVICGSVLTWLFCICYLIVSIFRSGKRTKR